MDGFLKNNHGVIVLGMEGKHSHWSLVSKVTNRSLLLFDSSNIRYLPRRNCTTSEITSSSLHYISPTHLIYLTCECDQGERHE